jgi:hypothetical protein
MQGSKVMHQSRVGTLAPEEPDELIAHVRVCGGAGWVTTGSTRKPTLYSVCCAPAACRLALIDFRCQEWGATFVRLSHGFSLGLVLWPTASK